MTGKGDRWEGDGSVGLSPPSEGQHHRTPSINLHCTARGRPTSSAAVGFLRGRPSAGCCFSRPVPGGESAGCVRLQWHVLQALFACRYTFAMPCPLPTSVLAPVHFACFAPYSFHVRQDRQQFASSENCPVGSCNTGLQRRPVRRFIVDFLPFFLQSP